jgi:glutamine synthetase
MGDDVLKHYLRCAQWEQEAFDSAVTQWELARGFERA